MIENYNIDVPKAELFEALNKLQSALKQPQKTHTGVHGAKYADLNDVANAIRKANKDSDAGLSFTQAIVTDMNAAGKESRKVVTYILHRSGESIAVEGLPVIASNNSQESMKAATYAKRGSLMAAFGVTPTDEDDDGQEITELQKHLAKETEMKRAVQAQAKRKLAEVDKKKIDAVWAAIGMERGSMNDVDKLSFAQSNAFYGACAFALNEDFKMFDEAEEGKEAAK
ncbi:ERF family protein [Leuconostocaceae bacterium ESL0958]|nr:ERF family protein [Leuconostocaceae bacterium ESL0958]